MNDSTPSPVPSRRRKGSLRDRIRSDESSDLAALSASYSAGLEAVSRGVRMLAAASALLEDARRKAASPSLSRYAVHTRLNPAVLRRAVTGVAQGLSSKLRSVKASGLDVPDGQESRYEKLVLSLSAATESIVSALEEFEGSSPSPLEKPPPAVRDLIVTTARAASYLRRLTGKSRAASAVHLPSVAEEILAGDVSFY